MRVLSIVLVALCVACGSTAPAKGAAHFAIVSGNNQTDVVADVHLPSPVQGQLYRQADGSVAFRVFDAMLPQQAYAQATTAKGGIAGAVVCWADVPGRPRLIPFSVCTNTQSNGLVTFSLRDDTVAGRAKGEIHWDSAGVPIVTDSVVATITPAAASTTYKTSPGAIRPLPAVVTDSSVQDRYGNPIPFRIVDPTGQLVLADTTFGSVGARTIVSGPDFATSVGHAGFTVELRSAAGVLLGHARYEISGPDLEGWIAAGLDISP